MREHSALGPTVSILVALGSVSSTVECPLIVTKHSLTALVTSAIVLLSNVDRLSSLSNVANIFTLSAYTSIEVSNEFK